jgi:hypothetical protein
VGTACYNTFASCPDLDNYARGERVLAFSSADAPLPFGTGERPYVQATDWLPTEIKDEITIQARVSLTMHDEPDADVGTDPYGPRSTPISTIPGTFWRKLVSRSPNFKGRKIEVYEGFVGLARADYQLRFSGFVDNITFNKDETVTVECCDKLSKLAEVSVPAEVNVGVFGPNAPDAAVIPIYGEDIADLNAAGYVVIGDNIIKYTSRWAGTNSGALYGCTWGILGSAKTAITAGDQVKQAKYYEPGNPFDIMLDLIHLAGFTDADIDLDAFAEYDYATEPAGDGSPNRNGWRDYPDDLIDFSAFIAEPVKALDLVIEIASVIDAKVWVNEQSQISIARTSPNKPGRTGPSLTDAANIIHQSPSLDLNDASRITRCRILWRQWPLEAADDLKSYRRATISIDADAESASGFGDKQVKEILCRWINLDCAPDVSPYETEIAKLQYLEEYVKEFGYRMINRHRYAAQLLDVEVDIKDEDMLVGSFCRVSTDLLVGHDGNGISDWPFQVVRRERTGKDKYQLKLLRMPKNRIWVIAPDTIEDDYVDALITEREFAYIAQANSLMPSDNSYGYSIY